MLEDWSSERSAVSYCIQMMGSSILKKEQVLFTFTRNFQSAPPPPRKLLVQFERQIAHGFKTILDCALESSWERN